MINAFAVKEVATIRQQPQQIRVFVVSQANGASRSCGVTFMGFEFGVYELWVGRDGDFIEAVSTPQVFVRGSGGAYVGGKAVVVEIGAAVYTGAHVGGIGDDHKYYEDPEGEPDAVPEATHSLACCILRAFHCFQCSIHFLDLQTTSGSCSSVTSERPYLTATRASTPADAVVLTARSGATVFFGCGCWWRLRPRWWSGTIDVAVAVVVDLGDGGVLCNGYLTVVANLPLTSVFLQKEKLLVNISHVEASSSSSSLSRSKEKRKSPSSILEEQPAWLSDLLSGSDSDSSGILHRRSASDSFTVSGCLVPLPGLEQLDALKTPDSCGPDNEFESGCAYGPNSPRRKGKVAFPENAIVSALSEYVLQSPLQLLDANMCVSRTAQPDSTGDAFGPGSGTNTEPKLMKRHPGQRSRVRKLQYIAELERTVDILQNLESDLAVRVTSLYQQQLALSMENSTLKQKMVRLQRERFNAEGEYHSLKKEYERLKMFLAYSSTSKVHGWSNSAADLSCSGDIWQTLDMRKLDLN
ncbi:unnamed protein product [Fraxinus pennsylvanica]|uniref:BZIP domain-containing protein n=1 Tax=Fraxinus pennsylvanica TaxID=56036 RepID=A0AAD2DPM3_9LAMI|nr:unnamed protein product [Fraxinus pennsylvanica]